MMQSLLLAATLLINPALAQDECPAPEPEEQSTWEAADGAFGKYVVGPLATVMFLDLVFWDNELPGYGFRRPVSRYSL